MEKNLDTTKPPYSDHIVPVLWRFDVSRFNVFHRINNSETVMTVINKRAWRFVKSRFIVVQRLHLLLLKGYSTPYFDFCSNCSICTIKTYERLKEWEKNISMAENCARKAKFCLIRGPEVKLTTFETRDQ